MEGEKESPRKEYTRANPRSSPPDYLQKCEYKLTPWIPQRP